MSTQRNPYLRANSLAELLSWQDEDFVRCAYVTMLGRQPEPDGEFYYVERVREGESRMKILWELRKSPEGRRHDPGIRGLDKRLRRASRQRLPIIGGLFRMFSSTADRNDLSDRRHRAQLNASTLERFALRDIHAKLGGIEWAVGQQLHGGHGHGGGEQAIAHHEPRAVKSSPVKSLLPSLKHLAIQSPLARYFASELN